MAESQRELGLDVTEAQIAEMKANINNIDYAMADAEEKKRRHDVMAHIHVFSVAAPSAGPIIHWGATSAFVQDNTELIVMRDGIDILLPKVNSHAGKKRGKKDGRKEGSSVYRELSRGLENCTTGYIARGAKDDDDDDTHD